MPSRASLSAIAGSCPPAARCDVGRSPVLTNSVIRGRSRAGARALLGVPIPLDASIYVADGGSSTAVPPA